MTDNEINREIAERVMGWESTRTRKGKPDLSHPFNPDLPDWHVMDDGVVVVRVTKSRWDKFDPANDPAAVFGPGGVVEKMVNKGFGVDIGTSNGGFTAAFGSSEQYGEAEALSITLAVCLAALAALEGEPNA